MSGSDLSRRDFHRLTAASVAGLMAGAAVGCGEKAPPPGPPAGTSKSDATASPAGDKPEPHACRGLNSCKTAKSDCAGKSACATVQHTCGGENTCKYLGGCGENPGANECKTKGGCAVPMKADHGDAWKRARAAFEARMTAQGKKFGEAPPEVAASDEKKSAPVEPKPDTRDEPAKEN